MIGRVLFTGTVTTASPFANSPIGAKNADKAALLPRLPVGGAMQPAIMPAVLRAALRQAATEELIERLGGRVSFPDFALYAVGGVKGSKKDGDEKVGVIARSEYVRRQHLVGLFGAGESPAGFARGAWSIGAAVATNADAVIIEGSRRPLNEDPRLVHVLAHEELAKAKRFGDINRSRSRKQAELNDATKALRKAKAEADRAPLQQKIKALQSELDAFASEGAELLSDVTIGMPLAGYEVIGANVTMAHRMAIDMAGDAKRLGLALAALERFGLNPQIGAHGAHGNGLINARWDVSLREVEGRRVKITPLGRVVIDTDRGCEIEGEPLQAALREWDAHPLERTLYGAGFNVQELADSVK